VGFFVAGFLVAVGMVVWVGLFEGGGCGFDGEPGVLWGGWDEDAVWVMLAQEEEEGCDEVNAGRDFEDGEGVGGDLGLGHWAGVW